LIKRLAKAYVAGAHAAIRPRNAVAIIIGLHFVKLQRAIRSSKFSVGRPVVIVVPPRWSGGALAFGILVKLILRCP
jgi:hypothetical protein